MADAVERVIVIGLDGFDPGLADELLAAGELPNLERIRASGGSARLGTTYPAQTPVAWSTFATGTNPGGHGIFDFLRRDPETYRPDIALHRYEQKNRFLPPQAVNMRRGTPVWQRLADAGIPSVVLRHPCTYPPDDGVRGRMLAGVGVPDVRGGFGTSAVYTSEQVRAAESERVVTVRPGPDGVVETELVGPRTAKGDDARVALRLEVDAEARRVVVRSSGDPSALEVREGEWSGWLRVKFKVGALQSMRGLVRFHLASAAAPFRLYASPVNFDPEVPAFPISEPWDYAWELERELGTFHTLGMAEDHNGLNNGRIDEHAFLRQCEDVFRERRAMMHRELARHDEGLFLCVFDTPDRIQHMFWRFREPEHPANRGEPPDGDFARVIEDHYRACDEVVGEAWEHADDETLFMVLSDHGFGGYRRGFHLNRWLHENGLLVLRDGVSPGDEAGDLLDAVDWSRTRAYSLGLAGIYLNRRGREAEGIVDDGGAAELKASIAERLSGLVDAERGDVAVRSVLPSEAVYRGPYAADSPDLVVNCAPGYRLSTASAMGGVPTERFDDNLERWSGDHVVDPETVPGVLFMSRAIPEERPHLVDLAPTILGALGVPGGPELEGEALAV